MVKRTEFKKKEKITTHVCENCLKDFKPKDVALVSSKSEDHRILYCMNCIEKLGVTDYTPYSNKKVKTTEDKPVKKVTRKNSTKTTEDKPVKKTSTRTKK